MSIFQCFTFLQEEIASFPYFYSACGDKDYVEIIQNMLTSSSFK